MKINWQIVLSELIWINVIVIAIIGCIAVLILFQLSPESNICDYDSCSQESFYWEVNGSRCFDSNNTECGEFLKLWDSCQHYRRRLGVC